jgi:hypothetical protein
MLTPVPTKLFLPDPLLIPYPLEESCDLFFPLWGVLATIAPMLNMVIVVTYKDNLVEINVDHQGKINLLS